MYRVLIVDDFFADRVNIRNAICSLKELNLEVVAEAENGLEAIDLIENNSVEIIICDIEMPICNGFELAKYIRSEFPEVKIIFCSLHNEFDYVKKALFFDSYGYLLKPINPTELEECIIKVIYNATVTKDYIKAKDMIVQYKPLLADNLLVSLLFGTQSDFGDSFFDMAAYLNIPLIKEFVYLLIYIEVDNYDKVTYNQSAEGKQILSIKISNRLKELLLFEKNSIVAKIDLSHFACILQFDKNTSTPDRSIIEDEICNLIITDFKKSDISLTISINSYLSNIHELKNQYEFCTYLMKYKFILGNGKIIKAGDIPSINTYPDMDYNMMIKDVRCLLNSAPALDIENYLSDLFTNYPSSANEQYIKNMCFMLLTCAQIVLSENNEALKNGNSIIDIFSNFETIYEEIHWIENLFKEINVLLAKKAISRSHQIVDSIKKYIDRNFAKNISMESMAIDLYYSSVYLNRIFKQETGETISDYATRFRVEKAKEFLNDKRYKLQDIADMLGYCNPAYFSNIFRKYTGLTPSEYRERGEDNKDA